MELPQEIDLSHQIDCELAKNVVLVVPNEERNLLPEQLSRPAAVEPQEPPQDPHVVQVNCPCWPAKRIFKQ